QDLLARPHAAHVVRRGRRDPERRTVNVGVILVDEGMVAAEIPVVQRSDVVVLVGDVAVQRGHRAQVRRTHACSSSGYESCAGSDIEAELDDVTLPINVRITLRGHRGSDVHADWSGWMLSRESPSASFSTSSSYRFCRLIQNRSVVPK